MLPLATIYGRANLRYMGYVGSDHNERMRYIGEPVSLFMDNTLVKGIIVDIEFESGVGPIFLIDGGRIKFWLTRKELRQYELPANNN
jgi:hypothetical protein